MQAQLEAREDKVRELKILSETARESEDRNALIIQQLRGQLMRYQSEFGNLEEVASRSGIAISSLQEDTREAHQRIFELESRLRWEAFCTFAFRLSGLRLKTQAY